MAADVAVTQIQTFLVDYKERELISRGEFYDFLLDLLLELNEN